MENTMTSTKLLPDPIFDDGRESGLSALRAALAEGEASGPVTPFDFATFLEGKRKPAE